MSKHSSVINIKYYFERGRKKSFITSTPRADIIF